MSINSFAAVVSDNDGATFITKAEFESLKNDFQTQINRYNSSIDNKISGTVASYVQGIKISDKPMLYLSNCRTALGRNPFFMNSVTGNGSSTWTTAINVSKQKNYSTQYKSGKPLNTYIFWIQSGGGDINLWPFNSASATGDVNTKIWYVGNVSNNNYAMRFRSYNTSFSIRGYNDGGFDSNKYSSWGSQIKHTGGLVYFSQYGTSMASTGVQLRTSAALRLGCDKSTFYDVECGGAGDFGNWSGTTKYSGTQTQPTTVYTFHSVSKVDSASRAGTGSCWQYRTTPWGTRVLERYYTSWWPVQNLVLDYKTYKDYSGTTLSEGSVAANALKDDQTCTYTPTLNANYGLQTTGTKYSTYNTTNLAGYCQQNITLNKSSTDTNLYEIAQWGSIPSTNIYCSVSEPTLTKTTTNLASSYTNLASGTVSIAGVSHTVTAVTNNVYLINGLPETRRLDSFEVNPYTGIAGETVYVGGGIPFAYTQTFNSETKFTIKFKTTTTANAATSAPVTWRLSTAQFKDGTYATASDKLADGTLTTNSSGVGTATVTLKDLPSKQLIWLNAYSTTASRIVEITDCSTDIK